MQELEGGDRACKVLEIQVCARIRLQDKERKDMIKFLPKRSQYPWSERWAGARAVKIRVS